MQTYIFLFGAWHIADEEASTAEQPRSVCNVSEYNEGGVPTLFNTQSARWNSGVSNSGYLDGGRHDHARPEHDHQFTVVLPPIVRTHTHFRPNNLCSNCITFVAARKAAEQTSEREKKDFFRAPRDPLDRATDPVKR